MNKDTLERLHETVLVPHGDPQLVLYTKLVVGLLWLVHLPLGFCTARRCRFIFCWAA